MGRKNRMFCYPFILIATSVAGVEYNAGVAIIVFCALTSIMWGLDGAAEVICKSIADQ